jgi:hypothetical protein
MSTSSSSRPRRRLFVAGGAFLLGVGSLAAGLLRRARKPRQGNLAEIRRLTARINLPGDLDSMMRSFSQDPDKVKRFRELTRWRAMRDEEIRRII